MKNSRPLYWHLELKVWSRAFSKLVDTSLCFQRRHQWFKSRESISYRMPFWFGQGKEIFWYWLILVYRFRITIYNSNCYHFFLFFYYTGQNTQNILGTVDTSQYNPILFGTF